MEKSPQFIKKFSKKESIEERKQTAQMIKVERAEYFTEKNSKTEKQLELQQNISERECILMEQLESIHNLENEIFELSKSRLGKILNYFQLQKLRADIAVGQKTFDELKQAQDTEVVEQKTYSEKLNNEEIPPGLQEAKVILSNFYKEQKEKWTKSEYTEDDIIENFSEEHLASLSLEDYVLLLKRFPKEMVAHVTRQGIRDHVGHMYHSAGEGVYADGFMKIIKDGQLRSPLGVYLVEGEKEKAIAKFLNLDNFKTKEEALDYLDTLTNEQQEDAGSYSDRRAIHFATEQVADCYYGSEKGNEIFIAYPSAHIASQYYFNGQLNKDGGGYWNDQWVWANEEKGMDLNAGLVFIPEEAMVNKKTGSRYEIDERGNPIKNSKCQDTFRKIVDSPNFHDFANQAMEIQNNLNQHWDSPDLLPKNQEIFKKLEPFCQKLEQEFGITDRKFQMAILSHSNLNSLDSLKKKIEEGQENYFDSIDSIIESAMKKEGILYKEAKNTISSKEFWEAHFAENPTKKPSKIIYYKGSDPTKALHNWQDTYGSHRKAKDREIGFSERNIKRSLSQATVGLDRFKTLAEKVIEDQYIQTGSVS